MFGLAWNCNKFNKSLTNQKGGKMGMEGLEDSDVL